MPFLCGAVLTARQPPTRLGDLVRSRAPLSRGLLSAEAEELSRSEVIRVAVADYLRRKRAL